MDLDIQNISTRKILGNCVHINDNITKRLDYLISKNCTGTRKAESQKRDILSVAEVSIISLVNSIPHSYPPYFHFPEYSPMDETPINWVKSKDKSGRNMDDSIYKPSDFVSFN